MTKIFCDNCEKEITHTIPEIIYGATNPKVGLIEVRVRHKNSTYYMSLCVPCRTKIVMETLPK
jgi:hypothetical protein